MVLFGCKPKILTYEEFKAEAMKIQAKKKAQAAAKKAAKAN